MEEGGRKGSRRKEGTPPSIFGFKEKRFRLVFWIFPVKDWKRKEGTSGSSLSTERDLSFRFFFDLFIRNVSGESNHVIQHGGKTGQCKDMLTCKKDLGYVFLMYQKGPRNPELKSSVEGHSVF